MVEVVPRIRLRLELERVKRERRKPLYVLAAEVEMAETRLAKILSGLLSPTAEERRRLSELVGHEEGVIFGNERSMPSRHGGEFELLQEIANMDTRIQLMALRFEAILSQCSGHCDEFSRECAIEATEGLFLARGEEP